MKNVHSPVYRPFARDAETLQMLVKAAVEAGGGFLLVAHLPDGDPAVPMLVESSRARGMLTLVERQHMTLDRLTSRRGGFVLVEPTRCCSAR
jgi:hypothetical protein